MVSRCIIPDVRPPPTSPPSPPPTPSNVAQGNLQARSMSNRAHRQDTMHPRRRPRPLRRGLFSQRPLARHLQPRHHHRHPRSSAIGIASATPSCTALGTWPLRTGDPPCPIFSPSFPPVHHVPATGRPSGDGSHGVHQSCMDTLPVALTCRLPPSPPPFSDETLRGRTNSANVFGSL